jgi:chromosome segregation ATPase
MNNVCKPAKNLIAIALFGCSIICIAWQKADTPPTPNQGDQHQYSDTGKPKRSDAATHEYRVDEIDKAMRNLDKELQKMDRELKKMDFSAIEKQVNEALATIDFQKIKAETDKALKNVDWDKIKEDANKSIAEAEVSLKDLKSEKFQKEMAQMQEELKKEKFNIKVESENIHNQIEKSMKQAKEEIEKAKAELKNYQEFTDQLEKDGLINKKKGYKVKVKNGIMIINGQQQPNDIFEKYKQYYKKDSFTLNSDGENISSL